jgi:hypothetical protein
MLANFSQYSPGLLPQFPQMIPGNFLQPGAHASYAPFGYDPRQFGVGYPYQQTYQQNQGLGGQASQIAPYLLQIAQQIFVHTAVAQQIGTALYQLAQQLSAHSHVGLDSWHALGAGAQPMIGAGQTVPFGTPFGNPGFLGTQGGQLFVQHPFATGNLQTQTWGANRPPTIQ